MNWLRLKSTPLISLAFAGVLTLTLFQLDSKRSLSSNTLQALTWARQVASQVESLSFAAREIGQSDPIAWASRQLSISSEPRVIRIRKLQSQSTFNAAEVFGLDRAKGVFEYTKILTPEEGSGVQIELAVGFSGFLGTRSRWMSDVALACFFSFFFFLIWFLLEWRRIRETHRSLKDALSDWITSAKPMLAQLGTHIRDLLKEAQDLIQAAKESRTTTQNLRNRVHSGLRELHRSRKILLEVEHYAKKMESLTKQLSTNDPKKRQDLDSELSLKHLLSALQKMRGMIQESNQVVKQLEIEMEPLATDADLALQAQQKIFKTTESMGPHIQRAKEDLLNQAKQLGTLKGA